MVYLEICLTSVVEFFYEVLSFSNKLHPKFLIHLSKSKSLVTIQASIVSFFGFFFSNSTDSVDIANLVWSRVFN